MDEKIGGYAFLVGVFIAIIVGALVGYQLGDKNLLDVSKIAGFEWITWVLLLLVVLGLVVGFLNIGDKEVMPFLMAAIALIVTGLAVDELKLIPVVGIILAQIMACIVLFAAPAALVVALLEFWKLASTPKGSSK